MVYEIKKQKSLQAEISTTSSNIQTLKTTYNKIHNDQLKTESQKHHLTLNLQKLKIKNANILQSIEEINKELEFYNIKMDFNVQEDCNLELENLMLFKFLKKIFRSLDTENEVVLDVKWILRECLDRKGQSLIKQLINESDK